MGIQHCMIIFSFTLNSDGKTESPVACFGFEKSKQALNKSGIDILEMYLVHMKNYTSSSEAFNWTFRFTPSGVAASAADNPDTVTRSHGPPLAQFSYFHERISS